MFKKSLLAITLASVATLSTAVNAAQSNGYLFASLGQSDADLSKSELDTFWGVGPGITSSLDSKDTAWKVGAGIQLNTFIGVELQYLDLGQASYKATDGAQVARTVAETSGFGLNAVGTLPLDRLSLFGKVGYHQLETDVDFSFDGFDVLSDSEKEWIVSYGVGASFAVTESFELVAEYERYNDVADDYDVDYLSAGLRYNF
ncbi:MAG: hypothetical protein CVV07_11455 [Gammaproteobacteria bacterium HGW-Gammaproteobacteria-11]|nr:MAG: hypothetical protein CVV07_11455 [Gammaproteobacteria bacterium HGW-Gammaproteobacteria-11]